MKIIEAENIPRVTVQFALASIVIWILSWLILWVSAEWSWADWIFEPAVVGMTLGFATISWFAAIYFREDDSDADVNKRLRSAIAGSVVLLFLLLVVDLLTITGLRGSLEHLNSSSVGTTGTQATVDQTYSFVKDMFDTFKWVVITVVGFYFAAGAAESVAKSVETTKVAATEAQKEVAMAQIASPSDPR